MTSFTPVTPLSSGSHIATAPATGAANSNDSLTSEDTFLKLLVAQIQNQDPTNPTDPIQFVGQLTQYSELEQLMQINSGVTALSGSPANAGTDQPTTPSAPITPLAAETAVARTQKQ